MHNYTKLRVYNEALDLAEVIYRETASFPSDERYGLTNQLRRSAVSVPSNVAEGCGRGSDADTARFLDMALGSLFEADTQLHLADRFGYADATRLRSRAAALRRQLITFRQRLAT